MPSSLPRHEPPVGASSTAEALTADGRMPNQATPPSEACSAPTTTPPRADPKNFADALQAARSRTTGSVQMYAPRPSAECLKALFELTAGDSWDEDAHLALVSRACPEGREKIVASVTVDTGNLLAHHAQTAFVKEFFGVNSADAEWRSLFPAIVQHRKNRYNSLVISVSSMDAKTTMLNKKFTLFGKSFVVATSARQQRDELVDSLFYLDITGVGAQFDHDRAFKALLRLKVGPLFTCVQSAVKNQPSYQGNAWRVYLRTTTAPEAALLHGRVFDQVHLDGRTYNVFCKGYVRLPVKRHGMRSDYCLDLNAALGPHAKPSTPAHITDPKRRKVDLSE
ncbi:hypothetical protein ACHHYP_13978, partial [Achlya hypogyna]